jgi:hypothetical protein
MSLLPTPILIAAQIDSINRETVLFLRSQAERAYELANTEGSQQAIMDALGGNASNALQTYAAIHSLLSSLGQADGIPEPDFQKWQVNQDGTVQFIAPLQE